jgi:predicted O-methyltransferase YrrM
MFSRKKKPSHGAAPALRGGAASDPSELAVWMDPSEFSQLLTAVFAVHPARVLEWGSGGSTRALLEQCPFIERYVSIEHDPEWYALVKARVTDPRLSLHHVPPALPPPPRGAKRSVVQEWNLRAERELAVMAQYVAFPRTLGLTFDFVLVDGRARTFCLREGFELLAPGGVLVLHDAQRAEYHDAVRALGTSLFLTPWTAGQICLIHKPREISP